MTQGKTIKVFMVSGRPTGLRTAEVSGWTGKVLVGTRLDLAELAARQEVKRTGVYMLVGQDPKDAGKWLVYVGESEEVLRRLVNEHEKDPKKDFWEETIVIVSKDENLTKSHVLYLESRLIAMIEKAGKATSANGTAPSKELPESDKADMESFLEQLDVLLPALGFDFLQPDPNPASAVGPVFGMSVPTTAAKATAVEVEGLFIVKAGSKARRQEVESLTANYRARRKQLLADKVLVDNGEKDLLQFAGDASFKSPSAAASVVAGAQTNGRDTWRIEPGGQTYGQWHARQLPIVPEPDLASAVNQGPLPLPL